MLEGKIRQTSLNLHLKLTKNVPEMLSTQATQTIQITWTLSQATKAMEFSYVWSALFRYLYWLVFNEDEENPNFIRI